MQIEKMNWEKKVNTTLSGPRWDSLTCWSHTRTQPTCRRPRCHSSPSYTQTRQWHRVPGAQKLYQYKNKLARQNPGEQTQISGFPVTQGLKEFPHSKNAVHNRWASTSNMSNCVAKKGKNNVNTFLDIAYETSVIFLSILATICLIN